MPEPKAPLPRKKLKPRTLQEALDQYREDLPTPDKIVEKGKGLKYADPVLLFHTDPEYYRFCLTTGDLKTDPPWKPPDGPAPTLPAWAKIR